MMAVATQTREQALSDLQSTLWVGGARYWRGQVMYRPTWEVVNLRREPIEGYWVYGPPTYGWFVYIRRVDDNATSQPPGTIVRRSLTGCFEGYGCDRPNLHRASR